MSLYHNCEVCSSSIEFGYEKHHDCTYGTKTARKIAEQAVEIGRLRAALDKAEKALQYYAEGMGDDEEDADYIEIHKDTLSERTLTYRGKKAREALKTIEKARGAGARQSVATGDDRG